MCRPVKCPVCFEGAEHDPDTRTDAFCVHPHPFTDRLRDVGAGRKSAASRLDRTPSPDAATDPDAFPERVLRTLSGAIRGGTARLPST